MKNFTLRAPLAVLPLAILASFPTHAQTVSSATLSQTVVTAARIPQDATLLPQGVEVITAEDIRATGMSSAREAIRWLGGVVSRSDTASGREPPLDLRGFGETASSNVVILVDGVRQNEGDMAATVLSWIPVDSIERIEVVRGSGAVLHGEGATAGMINIITSKGLAEPGGSVSLSLGSNATRDARLSLNTQAGQWRYQLHANAFQTDNHRDSFNTQEHNALARATWTQGLSLWSVQLGGQSSRGNQPSGLTPDDFEQRPTFAYNKQDTVKNNLSNLLVNGEVQLGDWRVALDANHRRTQVGLDQRSLPSIYTFVSDTETVSTRGGVRTWREFGAASTTHRFLMGADAENWKQANYFDSTKDGNLSVHMLDSNNIQQESRALYGRYEIEAKAVGVKAFAGARRTWSLRSYNGQSGDGGVDVNNTSWELGAAQRVSDKGEVFAKVGTSFRLPNANEYTCIIAWGQCNETSNINLLRPQTSKDFELGYRQEMDWGRWSARYYRHNLVDEIGYIPYANLNFEPTRRQGVELSLAARLGKAVDAGLQYAYREATFRQGQNAGNDLPLVPRQSLTARLSYRMSATQQWVLASQWVSSQRIGDDFANTSAERIPGYALVNLRYSQKMDVWTWAASINNLLDKHYYNYRTYSDDSASVYPEAGRTLLVTVQRRF